jgi:sensor domain CHASE-containing protein
MKNRYNEHLQLHLQQNKFMTIQINFILFCDTSGNAVWWDCYDLVTEERMESVDSLKNQILKSSSLFSYKPDALTSSVSGILLAEPFPVLVSSHPVLKGNNEGSIQGYVIMGRFLNPDLIEKFKEQSEFDFEVLPLQGENVPAEAKKIADQINNDNPQLLRQSEDNNYLDAYTTAPDIKGQKALLVKSKIPRKVMRAGSRAMLYAMVSMLIAGVFIFFGLRFILQRVILTPVSDLTEQMILVGKTGDLSAQLSSDRRDEIGLLGKEFERMLGKIKAKDDELVKANLKLEEDVKERERLISELEQALSEVKTLSGLLPICSSCKRIRDDKGYWNQIESYIHEHSEAQFSHSICPDCIKKLYPDMYKEMFEGKETPKTGA